MSGSTSLPLVDQLRIRHTIRYALGSALIMAIAMGIAWPLSFLAPVLCLGFFAKGDHRPTLKEGISFILTIAVSTLMGLLLGMFFIPYPMVFIPLMALLLLHLFYNIKIPALFKTWILISFLLLPMMINMSPELAVGISMSMVLGATIMIVLVSFVFMVIPDPIIEINPLSSKLSPSTTLPRERFFSALESTLVVLPLVILFHVFQWSGSILILIFAGILSTLPASARTFKTGMALIIGNVIGGVMAVIYYELMVTIPYFGFMILLILFAGFSFGSKVFSGNPKSALYGIGYSTLLLVIGSTTTATGAEADSKVWIRVIQITSAVIYVVLAFGIIDKFKSRKN